VQMGGYCYDRFERNNLGWFGLGLFVSGYGPMMGMCEHSNQPIGKITIRYFLYKHNDRWFHRNVPTPRTLWFLMILKALT
jgi:hypothetical protein